MTETRWGSVTEFVSEVLRLQYVADRFDAEAGLGESSFEGMLTEPMIHARRVYLRTPDSGVLFAIEKTLIAGKLIVSANDFSLRHAEYQGLRVAWATGAVLGKPAMLVATAPSTGSLTMTLEFIDAATGSKRLRRETSGPENAGFSH